MWPSAEVSCLKITYSTTCMKTAQIRRGIIAIILLELADAGNKVCLCSIVSTIESKQWPVQNDTSV